MMSLSLNELTLVAKSRGKKYYENKSQDELIKVLSEPKPKISLSKMRIKEIRGKFNELRARFQSPK